jgi:uncharacterized protein YjbI with pentapeptide repeats
MADRSERWSPSEDELKEILRKHDLWVQSDGEEGERADLSYAYLTGADLSEANLRDADLSEADLPRADLSEADLPRADLSEANLTGADLSKANLWGADLSEADLWDADLSYAYLTGADLSEANLTGADLSKANLWDADLSEADLWDADLSEAYLPRADLSEAILPGANLWGADLTRASLRRGKLQDVTLWGADLTDADLREANLRNADLGGTDGLQVQALARANTSNATLPDDVARFEGLKVVEAASQSARKLFIALGLACAYAALAISTEVEGTTLTLPFVQVDFSLRGFYHVVPVLLALGFGYFHLQMQRVWEEISGLPAIFPDGKAIDQKVHPWLVTGIARAHIPYLRGEPVRYFRLQRIVVIGLAWGSVPLTQAYFVVQFIDRYPEDTLYSGWGTALVAATLSGAILTYRAARDTLRGRGNEPFQLFLTEDINPFRTPETEERHVQLSQRDEAIGSVVFATASAFAVWIWWLEWMGLL